MGCARSKQALRDKPIAPLARSYSLPIHHHHHPAQGNGDNYDHVVALTSTTLGSLKLDPSDQKIISSEGGDDEKVPNGGGHGRGDDERSKISSEVLTQAKAWSNEVRGKISQMPKTPIQTPPNEPETINAWELMDGLEDSSPSRSFSFRAFPTLDDDDDDDDTRRIPEIDTVTDPKAESPKPIWLQFNAAADPIIADFDPEILSHFRKALDELSPPNTCRLRSPEPEKPGGTVRERIRAFQERIDGIKKVNRVLMSPSSSQCPPRGEERVVIYFTSLRGVRKTYEDCCNVRLIFKGCGVRADERDVSMHQGFRQELFEVLGTESFGGLPRVFVKGRYVGGAEDVRQMHESGELEKLIQGCERLEPSGSGAACTGCGDVRFVPCDRCFGSCKLFDEEEDIFLRCPDCNENGIVCCPLCCT